MSDLDPIKPIIDDIKDAKKTREEFIVAFMALNLAFNKLSETFPQASHYNKRGHDAIITAIRQHQDRMKKINLVICELDDIIGYMDDEI